ncbi:MAG: membrane dipeptidase [Clostridia bacterium]|nr:membrane dipeptidase [Clostridia bacterium]MDY6185199.1 membrane dipeptidase [Eubacteriales bacterium]
MRIWLLHADTPYRMYRERKDFQNPALHIHADALRAFEKVRIGMAYWTDKRLTDEEGWNAYLVMQADAQRKFGALQHDFFGAVEDARILAEDPLPRLKQLWRDGVRVITPFWAGENPLGGAHDTDTPLTPLGRFILTNALAMGFLLDTSHASRPAFWDMAQLTRAQGVPLIATHSNFFDICPHTRNLTREEALAISLSGGLIGLNFVPAHVGAPADIDALSRHIDYALANGLGDALALGSDFDGVDTLACSLHGAEDLSFLADTLSCRFGSETVEQIFHQNAETRLGGWLSSVTENI